MAEPAMAEAAAQWSLAALLAIPTAIAVRGIELAYTWSRETGWSTILGISRCRWRSLAGLAILEGAAGLAATGLVVLLGVTKPGWIDEPGGWLLLGMAGPALAAVSIAKFPVGGAEINIGLSLVYVPLRQMLLNPIDSMVYTAARPVQAQNEALYRRRAGAAFDDGTLTPEELTAELRKFAARPLRDAASKAGIESKLESLAAVKKPAQMSQIDWDRERLGMLVAAAIELRVTEVLDALIGEPTEEERGAVATPTPPDQAVE